MRNYVIVAPYGNKELDEACENANKYPLVYLRSDSARQAFEKGEEVESILLFCEKSDYQGMDKSYYCHEVVERAFDALAQRDGKDKYVFVVLPTGLLDIFIKVLATMHMESRRDTLIPPFATLIERFEAHYPFIEGCVFSVQWVKRPEGYLPNLGRYYADNPQEEPAYPSASIEEKAAIENMYLVLLAGDLASLSALEVFQLEKLEKRSLEDQEYELAAAIRDVRRKKAS